MGPLSKYIWIFEDFSYVFLSISYHYCTFNDFSSFLFLRLSWYHSITFNIFLNDLIYCRSCNANSFGNICDWHPDGSQIPIFAESQFNDLDFHGKLHLGPLLQEFVQVSDWQVYYFRILFFQNNIWWILLHLFMEVLSFHLNGLDLIYLWIDKFRKVVFSYMLIIVIAVFNVNNSSASLRI